MRAVGYPKIVITLVFLVVLTHLAFADTVILKNGQTIEGKIVEKTDAYVKINFEGVGLTYFKDEIEKIIYKTQEPAISTGSGVTGFTKQEVDSSKLVASKATTSDLETLLQEVLELSGLKLQLPLMFGSLKQMFDSLKLKYELTKMTPQEHELSTKILDDLIQPNNLYAAGVDYFRSHVDKEHLVEVLVWFRSPLARKITELEIVASVPADQLEKQKFIMSLQSRPPDLQRLTIVKNLNIAVHLYGSMLKSVTAMLVNFSEALPFEKRAAPGEIEEKLKSEFLKQQLLLEQANLVSSLYTYRSLSDDELIQYTKFLTSSGGQWMAKLVEEMLSSVFGTIGREFGGRMSEAFKAKANQMQPQSSPVTQ